MNTLTLHPGPRLLRMIHPDGAPPQDEDVTDRAVEFLFDRLELGPDVRLRDLFGLFERCPVLLQVYRRFYAQEICADAALGPVPDDEKSNWRFLELRHSWDFNSHTREYSEVRRLHLTGVGELPEHSPYRSDRQDGLMQYGMTGAYVRPMLDLPLRMETELVISEADEYSTRFFEPLTKVACRDLALGELLQAVLWEMTWFGPPAAAEEVIAEMVEHDSDPESWLSSMDMEESLEYFLGDDYRRGCQALFETTGPLDALRIAAALKKIPDHLNARQWLNKTLGKQVRLRPAFRRMSGRELRQAFDQASDEASASARQASLQ